MTIINTFFMKNSFAGMESRLDASFARKRVEKEQSAEHAFIEEAHNRAIENFEDEGEIDPTTFKNYGRGMVSEDLKYVARMEKIFEAQQTPFEAEAKKLATIFEAIIHEQIELNNWLGDKVTTRKASRYDDIKNGVDTIAELEHDAGGTSHLALALDITYSNPMKKLDAIRTQIDKGTLTEVKYFESSDGGVKGTLSRVPRVVIGADRPAVLELAHLWMEKKGKGLADHPMQMQILDEIAIQLTKFAEYARSQSKIDIAEIFERQLRLVNNIYEQKKELSNKPGIRSYGDTDVVFQRIISDLKTF